MDHAVRKIARHKFIRRTKFCRMPKPSEIHTSLQISGLMWPDHTSITAQTIKHDCIGAVTKKRAHLPQNFRHPNHRLKLQTHRSYHRAPARSTHCCGRLRSRSHSSSRQIEICFTGKPTKYIDCIKAHWFVHLKQHESLAATGSMLPIKGIDYYQSNEKEGLPKDSHTS